MFTVIPLLDNFPQNFNYDTVSVYSHQSGSNRFGLSIKYSDNFKELLIARQHDSTAGWLKVGKSGKIGMNRMILIIQF